MSPTYSNIVPLPRAPIYRFSGYALVVLLALVAFFTASPSSAETKRFFGSAGDQDFLPVEEAFPFSQRLDGDALILQWDVTPGYYLYQERITVNAADPSVTVGPLEFERAGLTKEDPYFGSMKVYYETVTVRVPVSIAGDKQEARLDVSYQGCAEAGLCYPPETQEVLYVASDSSETAPTGSSSPGSGAEPSGRGSLETANDLVAFLTRADPVWVALAFFAPGWD